eukprot:COSAG01_NODE_10380_length_2181_cov_1.611431_2_plen_144_part_00
MTKMHVIGMPWEEVIRASTSTPAAAIGWGSRIGSLAVGMEADLALLEVRDCDFWMEDSQAQMRRCRQRLVAKAVWKAGQRGVITMPEDMPDVRGRPNASACLPASLCCLITLSAPTSRRARWLCTAVTPRATHRCRQDRNNRC